MSRPAVSGRHSAARTAVVWDALRAVLQSAGPQSADGLRVLDIGGGTGGFAVGVAELGHRVMVVDPSPDALAILDRRSEESGVADRVTGVQGDLSTLSSLVGDRVDVVLCHGVLGVVDDPDAAVAALTDVLVPGGVLSLLVGQRHAAVVARAMAGHFDEARTLLDGDPPTGQPRRFTAEEITVLLHRAGFRDVTLHAVRVFGDVVPGSLVDLEPGAADALAALERAVADRAEYLTLAAQVHALATLDRSA
jgi:SAM-dependent methyltransferase